MASIAVTPDGMIPLDHAVAFVPMQVLELAVRETSGWSVVAASRIDDPLEEDDHAELLPTSAADTVALFPGRCACATR